MRTFSLVHRRKLSEGKRGDKNPNYGKTYEMAHNLGRKLSDDWKRKIGEGGKGKHLGSDNPMFGMRDDKSPTWKGDSVRYSGVHIWFRKHVVKPKECQRCQKKTTYIDAANLSGSYDRDVNDWMYLCRSCHKNIDKMLLNFIECGHF